MNQIYYFSGTGNSLQIAKDLAGKLQDTEIKKVTDYQGEVIEGETLGIVFPVYFWGIPLIIEDFLKKVEVADNTYIYAIANYGGVAGKALDQCESILEERKRKLQAGFLIHMPGNYIVGYGAVKQKIQDKLFQKEKERVEEISKVVASHKNCKIEKTHLMIDRLFAKAVYKKVAKFPDNDRNFTVNPNCISCGKCESLCPVNNIKIESGVPVWQHHCQMCLSCIQHCPVKAIQYGNKTKNRKRYTNPNI